MKGNYRIRKMFAAVCALAMGMSVLTGCGSTENDFSDTEATGTDSESEETLTNAEIPDIALDEVVLTVGDEEITEEEVLVYIMTQLLDGQKFYSYIENSEDAYKDEILTAIRETKILYKYAVDSEMEFNDDDMATVDTLIQSFKDNVGEDVMADYGISEDMLTKVITEQSYVSKLENDTQNELGQALTEKYNEEYKDYNFQTVYYMMFPTIEEDESGDPLTDDDGNYVALDDDAKAEAKQQAEAAMAEVSAGKDAEEVAEAYGVDSYSDDRAGVQGQYSGEINEELSKLSEGECTGLYESAAGYYFVTILTDNDQDLFDAYVYSQVSDEVDSEYETKKQEWVNEIPTADSDLKDGIWENFNLVGLAADLKNRGLLN